MTFPLIFKCCTLCILETSLQSLRILHILDFAQSLFLCPMTKNSALFSSTRQKKQKCHENCIKSPGLATFVAAPPSPKSMPQKKSSHRIQKSVNACSWLSPVLHLTCSFTWLCVILVCSSSHFQLAFIGL